LLNRFGFGPLRYELSSAELRIASLRGMGAVVESLDLGAEHVIFGHTHRCGPLPDDVQEEWIAPCGARLMNAGSWVFETHFMNTVGPSDPYWPGGAVLVEDVGPPRHLRLLSDWSAEALRRRGEGAPAPERVSTPVT
jgi:hypothetical protein